MIYGIGTDIVETDRFEKWIHDWSFLRRFFNEKELLDAENVKDQVLCEHYASRFAAKEAFSKALGTGIAGFELKDICLEKNNEGKPYLTLYGSASEIFNERCGKGSVIHLSISHEKKCAVAYAVIEKL